MEPGKTNKRVAMTGHTDIKEAKQIESLIYTIRDQRVILDHDLAALHGVPTFRFNEAVKHNRKRFPDDFVFRLTAAEYKVLTSQIAISKFGRGGRRTLPYAIKKINSFIAHTS
jgi:hypothetical protein